MRIHSTVKKGFTLIELIVVMAVLGVLATIVIVAVNPLEQISRGRDTARLSAITQVGQALVGYRIANNGIFPTEGTTWMNSLSNSLDLSSRPTNADYVSKVPCNDESTHGQNGFCYKTGTNETIIYAQLESNLYNKNCSISPYAQAYWVFSVGNSGACVVCGQAGVDPDVSAVVACSN